MAGLRRGEQLSGFGLGTGVRRLHERHAHGRALHGRHRVAGEFAFDIVGWPEADSTAWRGQDTVEMNRKCLGFTLASDVRCDTWTIDGNTSRASSGAPGIWARNAPPALSPHAVPTLSKALLAALVAMFVLAAALMTDRRARPR